MRKQILCIMMSIVMLITSTAFVFAEESMKHETDNPYPYYNNMVINMQDNQITDDETNTNNVNVVLDKDGFYTEIKNSYIKNQNIIELEIDKNYDNIFKSDNNVYFVKTADNEYQMVDKVTFDVKKFESYKAIEEYEIPQIILNDIASVAAYAEDMGCSDACVTLFIEKSNSLSKSSKPNTIARSKSVWQNKTFYHYQVYFTGLSTTWINLAMGGNTTEAALKSIKSLGFYVVGKATTTLGDVIDLFDVGKNCLDAWKAAKGTTPIYCNSENKVQAKLDYNLFFKYTFYYDPILKKECYGASTQRVYMTKLDTIVYLYDAKGGKQLESVQYPNQGINSTNYRSPERKAFEASNIGYTEKVYGKINKQRIIFATPTFDWPDDWPTL